jgi:hypothetical protein
MLDPTEAPGVGVVTVLLVNRRSVPQANGSPSDESEGLLRLGYCLGRLAAMCSKRKFMRRNSSITASNA